MLSAILLKQCLVPSPRTFFTFLIVSWSSATVLGVYKLSVLYVRFPAQLVRGSDFGFSAHENYCGNAAPAAKTEEVLRKVLLFILIGFCKV